MFSRGGPFCRTLIHRFVFYSACVQLYAPWSVALCPDVKAPGNHAFLPRLYPPISQLSGVLDHPVLVSSVTQLAFMLGVRKHFLRIPTAASLATDPARHS